MYFPIRPVAPKVRILVDEAAMMRMSLEYEREGLLKRGATYNHRDQHPYASRYQSIGRRDMPSEGAVRGRDIPSICPNEGNV